MTRSLRVLACLLFAGVVGCNNGLGAGTPPAPGGVGAAPPANSASNVGDAQAAGDVADYYLARMAYGSLGQRMTNRIAALSAFETRAAGAAPSPAPAATGTAAASLPKSEVALPTTLPSFTPQTLEPPTFPSDDAPAQRLATQGGVSLVHNVVDPKSPTQPPVDRIEITRGGVRWTIDLLTGLVTYEREHTTGVIENGAERAQEVAQAFVQRHGGIPNGAVEVDPVYRMTAGDSSSVPKPTSITFVWRHGDPSIIGADAIAVTVTPTAPTLSSSPGPSSGPGLEVTSYTRLWRKAGAPLDAGKTPPMSASQALEQLARSGAVIGDEKVQAVVFGGLRGPATAAPRATRPAWAFRLGGANGAAWYAVDALDGAVSGSTALGVPSDAIAMTSKAGAASPAPAATASGAPATAEKPAPSPTR